MIDMKTQLSASAAARNSHQTLERITELKKAERCNRTIAISALVVAILVGLWQLVSQMFFN